MWKLVVLLFGGQECVDEWIGIVEFGSLVSDFFVNSINDFFHQTKNKTNT